MIQDDTFHIITFGCQMNVRDSDWLSSCLEQEGWIATPPEKARLILLNTCSVREKPEHKVRQAIAQIRSLTGGNPEVLVGVLGCVAQQLGTGLLGGQVRLVAGGDSLVDVPAAIRKLLALPRERLALLEFSHGFREPAFAGTRVRDGSAFVTIMQGCNNFCSYCIVPFTRGREKFRTARAILQDCEKSIARGAREITLLGQNVNSWRENRRGFADLLKEVALLPGYERLRYVTPHPADMDEASIRAFGELPRLCPRLHLPLQAGSNTVLQKMRRRYDAAAYLKLVAELRKVRPDIALSTDLIVGFPGETEEDFQDTLEVVKQTDFMASFSFIYSDRPGTRAEKMDNKVPSAIQHRRLVELQGLQDELSARWLKKRVGDRCTLLLQGPSPRGGSWQGKDEYGAPVNVLLPEDRARRGELIEVAITDARKHSLIGQPILPGEQP